MVPHRAAGGRAVPAASGSPAAGPAPVVPPVGVGAPDGPGSGVAPNTPAFQGPLLSEGI